MDQQRIRNALKNLALLILFLGMLALTFLTWLTNLRLADAPSSTLISKVYQKFTYGVGGFEIRTGADPAAQPTRVAVTLEGELVGAQYQAAAVSTLYDALRGSMSQALSNSGSFAASTQDDFTKALQGEVLYFGYEGALPVSLLAGWMEGETASAQLADALLLTEDGQLYLHGPEGYWMAETTARPDDWQTAMENYPATACRFAGTEGLTGVRPDTLLSDDGSLRAEQLAVQPPNLQGTLLLDAFAYDPHVRSYTENQGATQVYAENYSTLHVSADGTVEFRTSALEGGMQVYNTAETAREDTLRLQVDFAYTLLKTVQSSVSDSSQAMLYDVAEGDDGVRVLTFIQLVGGIPVAADPPFARFEFQDDRLVAAQIHLSSFQSTGVQTALLGSAQAASAAPAAQDAPARLAVVYRVAEGTATAERCYVS